MRTVLKSRWGLVPSGAGDQELVGPVTVTVDANQIVEVRIGAVEEPAASADEFVETRDGVLLPGFVNLHNHSLNAPLFRGVTDDLERGTSAETLVYSLLMPLGDLAATVLTAEEMSALYRLAVLEALKSGVTCMLDMWRAAQPAFLSVATELGLRGYGAPYIASSRLVGVSPDGQPLRRPQDWQQQLRAAVALFERFDEGTNGRIRVFLGPHCTDTCTPEALAAVARTARELGTGVTVHAAQSVPETVAIQEQYGMTPVQYLDHVGMLDSSVVLAHAVYASTIDLELVRDRGATVANCARTFASGGIAAPFERFAAAGVRTGIGTDSCRMDFFAELRTTGFVSKLSSQRGDVATARELLAAATAGGAAALRRSDLGRLEVGARADLVVVDLSRPSLQPVRDPLRNVVWNATPADVALVMVDGAMVVRDGRHQWADEAAIIDAAASATEKVWACAESQGIIGPATAAGDRRIEASQ